MEKFQEELKQAIKHMQIADHMAYVTYPLVNEKKLLLRIFDKIYNSIMCSINSSIYYESMSRKTTFETPEQNIRNFIEIFAKDYGLTFEQVKKIKEIYETYKKHRESAIEFVKKDKVIIMSDNFHIQAINIQKIKEYLLLSKELIIKISSRMR